MTVSERIWILGAPDPEMEAIESLLRECGEQVAYAVVGVDRVTAANATRAERAHYLGAFEDDARTAHEMGHEAYPQTGRQEIWVECDGLGTRRRALNDVCEILDVTRIDHHRPGDPGFGRPPEEFLAASSIGQVTLRLYGGSRFVQDKNGAWWRAAAADEDSDNWLGIVPHALVMIAAADHCLGAAYAGKCPGVDPVTLGEFRAAERARFSGRNVGDVLADIATTTEALKHADSFLLPIDIGPSGDEDHCAYRSDHRYRVIDMRRPEGPWPELPEAATRAGVSYISGPLSCPDGRQKVTCSGTREVVEAFIFRWGPANGLTDIYGDPARGFGGGYLA
jgi:hypothetical protein